MSGEPQLICRVVETFVIAGRGLVLCPDAAPAEGMVLRIGDPVSVRTPDGRTVNSHIRSIHMLTPNPRKLLPFMLDPSLTKSDIPIGSEIWTRPASSHGKRA